MKDESLKNNQTPQNKRTKSQKVVLIGDSNVGKTSVCEQFIENKFGETKPSIGALHKFKNVILKSGEDIQLDVWDTAGQEKFKSIVPMYYKGAKGIMIVYDITNSDSFEGAKKWLNDVESASNSSIIFLIGNKKDLEDKRRVSTEEAQSFAQSKNITHYECSAKQNIGIIEAFTQMAEKFPKVNENINSSKLTINNAAKSEETSYCCS